MQTNEAVIGMILVGIAGYLAATFGVLEVSAMIGLVLGTAGAIWLLEKANDWLADRSRLWGGW